MQSSLLRTFTGYILGITLGITVATVMSLSKIMERSLYPYAILLQTVPVVAVAPVFVLWFGFEESQYYHRSSSHSFQSSTTPSWSEIHTYDFGGVFRTTSHLNLFHFSSYVPSAIPNIIAGMRISAGLSVIGAIVGEFIIGSGSEDGGLGVQIIYAQAELETPLVMALILTATLLGFAFFMTVSGIGYYLLHNWHESER